MRELSRDVLALPISVRAEMALKAAVEKVIEEHVRGDLPIYVWRNGQVTEIPPQELTNFRSPISKR
ncbi:MAG: hypothetical protein ACREB3_07260 [Burkholderiales bacterium]